MPAAPDRQRQAVLLGELNRLLHIIHSARVHDDLGRVLNLPIPVPDQLGCVVDLFRILFCNHLTPQLLCEFLLGQIGKKVRLVVSTHDYYSRFQTFPSNLYFPPSLKISPVMPIPTLLAAALIKALQFSPSAISMTTRNIYICCTTTTPLISQIDSSTYGHTLRSPNLQLLVSQARNTPRTPDLSYKFLAVISPTRQFPDQHWIDQYLPIDSQRNTPINSAISVSFRPPHPF
mmetsp:Transcript_12984/g.22281  ORF Transcript_12984/g.22281 Transcript_12984/m.22281 type:complete len:232 (-) Transcript_12984:48-743(-)